MCTTAKKPEPEMRLVHYTQHPNKTTQICILCRERQNKNGHKMHKCKKGVEMRRFSEQHLSYLFSTISDLTPKRRLDSNF
mmetsp:Transcript_19864/g.31824  ORF Transcript_19864/g.31824 Transcript_19864/m.31824 type:complete len:80 (-) Transcript_19864:1859-2098(-)